MIRRILAGLFVTLIPSFVLADDLPFKLQLVPTPDRVLKSPVYITNDGTKRLFIVNQIGQILLMIDGQIQPTPYLDITSFVRFESIGQETGLLSVAFHPDFAHNGLFYVDYTTDMVDGRSTSGRLGQLQTHVSEFHADPTAAKVDPSTERLLLTIDKPYDNHDGGQLQFGPDDGCLYLGTGDGGNGNDPGNRAQNPMELLGKMIRIDVNHRDPGLPYAIPKDNPFVGKPGYRPELWTIGMRNPWRYSFDRQTHLLWVGDVGQDAWEEIDIITKGGNYGWHVLEATHQNRLYPNEKITADLPIIPPIFEYPHPNTREPDRPPGAAGAACIIGGYVYRGKAIPELQGTYVFADYSHSWFGTLRYENGKVTSTSIKNTLTFDYQHVVNGNTVTAHVLPQLSGFGEDVDGELYALDYSHNFLLKLVPAK